jgi:hypothetical protein
MSKQLRVTFSSKELEELIIALHHSSADTEALSEKLSHKFFTNVSPAMLTDKVAGNSKEQEVFEMLTKAISILTGRDKDDIELTDTLPNLGFTPSKTEQLRIHVNKFISKEGSSKFITSAEMGKINTVSELHKLILTKIK